MGPLKFMFSLEDTQFSLSVAEGNSKKTVELNLSTSSGGSPDTLTAAQADLLARVRERLGKLNAEGSPETLTKSLKDLGATNIKQITTTNPSASAAKVHQTAALPMRAHQVDIKQYGAVALARGEEAGNRLALQSIRARALDQVKKGVPGAKISQEISEEIAKFTSRLYEEGIKSLGKPPCDYCLVAFGSLARKESGPFPDFDNMLIVSEKTPESTAYFTKLNQYVADRVFRLGESENLGKPGLRFCEGNINPPYQKYDFRYADTPQPFRMNITPGTRVGKEFQKVEGELKTATADLDKVQADIEALKKRNPPTLKKDLEALEAKRDALASTKSNLTDRWKELVFGGRKELLAQSVEPPPSVPAAQADAKKGNAETTETPEEQDRNFIRRVMTDSLPILGNSTLYDDYMSRFQTAPSGKAGDKSVGESDKAAKLHKQLKSDLGEMTSGIVKSPIAQNKLNPLVNIKHHLYRFPQTIVSYLSNLHDVKATNTIDRIMILKDKGVIGPELAVHLANAMNDLVKLRVISQMSYGEEFECVSTGDWESFNKVKQDLISSIGDIGVRFNLINVKDEVAKFAAALVRKDRTGFEDLKDKVDRKIDDLRSEIDALKKQASDPAAKIVMDFKQKDLDSLQEMSGSIWRMINELSQVEAKEFRRPDPRNPDARLKDPVLDERTFKELTGKTLPALNWLYKACEIAVRGKEWDPSPFQEPMMIPEMAQKALADCSKLFSGTDDKIKKGHEMMAKLLKNPAISRDDFMDMAVGLIGEGKLQIAGAIVNALCTGASEEDSKKWNDRFAWAVMSRNV